MRPLLPALLLLAATPPVYLGRVPLRAGPNEVVVELLGKDGRSAGYGDGLLVGVDGFTLEG